jgi:hypothetical protein
MLERRKNAHGFPVPSRIINGLLRSGCAMAARGSRSAQRKQKGRREAGLFAMLSLR